MKTNKNANTAETTHPNSTAGASDTNSPSAVEHAQATIGDLKEELAEKDELISDLKEELAEKDDLIKEQAAHIEKLENKLSKSTQKLSVEVEGKNYTINSGAYWNGKDFSPADLREAPMICQEIIESSDKQTILTEEV
jgi:predicted  nucleic acid-binding Zn-ribbon protein